MTARDGEPTHSSAEFVAEAARRVVEQVWRAVDRGVLDARSPLADAALDLRDAIDPSWNPARNVDNGGGQTDG